MNTKRTKIFLISSLLLLVLLFGAWVCGLFLPHNHLALPTSKDYNFYFITDIGSVTGPGAKKEVVEQMNLLAPTILPRYIISAGDNFHSGAAMSATDPVWKSNFEQYFKTGAIKDLDWYATLGNHDYTGNPQAQIDYGKTHPHWIMPARYYTFVKKTDDSASIRFIIIDTNPFQTKYHTRTGFADLNQQDMKKQLHWLDSVLAVSHETWKVVMGHHPIVHSGLFTGVGPELLDQVNPILLKYKVDFYFAGHVHNFQHLTKDSIDYVISSTTWKSRTITPWFHSKYWKNATGFTICSVNAHHFRFYFIDEKGKVLYSYSREK